MGTGSLGRKLDAAEEAKGASERSLSPFRDASVFRWVRRRSTRSRIN